MCCQEKPVLLDASELMRPELAFADKPIGRFRDYTVDENDPIKERVQRTYKNMHTNMTVDFVKGNYISLKYIFSLFFFLICLRANVSLQCFKCIIC